MDHNVVSISFNQLATSKSELAFFRPYVVHQVSKIRYIFRTHRDKRLISLATLTVGLTNRGERDSSSFWPVEFLIVTPRRDKVRCNAELKGKLKRENYHLPDPRRGLGEIGNSGGIIPNRVSS